MISQVVLVAAIATLAAAHGIGILPVHHAPQPYKFGYDVKDMHGEQYRQEEGNSGNAVKGSYGFTDARGVKRHVNYVADHAGFRAQVKTNEPGTANQNPAAVLMVSDAPYAGRVALGGLGYGVGNLGLGGIGYGNGLGLVNGGLVNGGLVNGGLVNGGLVNGGLVNRGLVNGGLVNGAIVGGLNGRGLGGAYGINNGLGYGGLGLGIQGGLGYARYGY